MALGLLAGCSGEPHTHVHRSFDHTGPDLAVTWSGRPLKLSGTSLKVGDVAPDAAVHDPAFAKVRLSDYRGKVVLLSVVPELGTPVCDQTTRMLENAAPALGKDVAVLTVSADSVWEQSRWRQENRIQAVETLSDAQLREFGRAYGLAIEGRGELMRAVLVLDRQGVIRHVEVVEDMADFPDLAKAQRLARELAAG